MSVAVLVLGLVALALGLIPFAIVVAWIPAVLAIILGATALATRRPLRGASITGLSAAVAAIIVGATITGAIASTLPLASASSSSVATPVVVRSTSPSAAPTQTFSSTPTPTPTAVPSPTTTPGRVLAAAPKPSAPARPSVYYANCSAAWAAGAAPILAGEPGYRSGLDRDGDGIACEERPSVSAPTTAPGPAAPAGATAICNDGTYSYSLHHSGTCSHHGGVASWL